MSQRSLWYPDLPVLPDDEQRWFKQAEIRQIVDAATGQYKVLFHLAGYLTTLCEKLGIRPSAQWDSRLQTW
jgi:hypothetical protein